MPVMFSLMPDVCPLCGAILIAIDDVMSLKLARYRCGFQVTQAGGTSRNGEWKMVGACQRTNIPGAATKGIDSPELAPLRTDVARLMAERDYLQDALADKVADCSQYHVTRNEEAAVVAERDAAQATIRAAIERLTPTADELDSMACAGTPDVYLEQWLRECLNAPRTRADSAEGALAHVMAENTAKTELLQRIHDNDGWYDWPTEIDALFTRLSAQEWSDDAAPDR